MRIHQQRVPIISPLDRDHHRGSYDSDYLNISNTSLSSYENQSTGDDDTLAAIIIIDSEKLRFTIVGERDVSD